ncbi:MAG: GNAT family N-acetyltransferase [Candidatus Brocadiaceae bacterium]|nr:GNAT family N-acetyltransferase [Candidatus Brocadiaceae bacterium]
MTIDGPKAVAPEEFRSAMELVDATFRPGQPGGMEKHFPLMLCRENAGHLRVFTDDGRVVAFVGMFVRDVRLGGSLHRTCCIGAVCTDPQYRGRGLGTRLMDDAVTTALADRVDLFLISGTRGLYTRLGYVCVGAYPVYSIEAARLPADGPYVLRPWQPEDLPALVGLHAAEPVRFVRTPSDFLALLRCGLVCDAPGDTELVCRRSTGRPVAYLSYQVGGRHKAADALTAVEMAGSRWAVAHGLRLLLTKRNAAGLHLRAMGSDCEAAELAHAFGWPSELRGFRGTVGIADPARFWSACAADFAERLGQERAGRLRLDTEGGLCVRYGAESLPLGGMTGLTELVFQARDRRADLPLAPESELRGVLDELFPLPLVDYGLNFI